MAALPIILLTGFEPFGGAPRNVSAEVVRALDGARIAGHRVHGAVLPCVFARAPAALLAAVADVQPAVVLCLGLAMSRRGFSPERVAINLIDARIADNAGDQPVDVPVVSGAPAAVFTGLPVKAMTAALQAAGLEAELSFSAGSYVCNQVFFALLHALPAAARGGFMHLGGDLDAATAAAGVRVALAAALANAHDLSLPAGRLD